MLIAGALIFGVVPALQIATLDPEEALQAGAVRTASKSMLRQALVVAEVALSLILLAGAGLMLRSFHRLVSVHPGFETEHILTMTMFTSPAKYSDDRKRAAHFPNLLDGGREVPAGPPAASGPFLPLARLEIGSRVRLADYSPP